jgi:hypothetical protein
VEDAREEGVKRNSVEDARSMMLGSVVEEDIGESRWALNLRDY